jgi:toxin secretion/phage lysis holin
VINIIVIIVSTFIVLDILSGLIKALKNNEFKSSIMRQGLYSKAGSFLILFLAYLGKYACTYINLGFELPLVEAVSVYICIMEIGSILENAVAINPELDSNALLKIFKRKE